MENKIIDVSPNGEEDKFMLSDSDIKKLIASTPDTYPENFNRWAPKSMPEWFSAQSTLLTTPKALIIIDKGHAPVHYNYVTGKWEEVYLGPSPSSTSGQACCGTAEDIALANSYGTPEMTGALPSELED